MDLSLNSIGVFLHIPAHEGTREPPFSLGKNEVGNSIFYIIGKDQGWRRVNEGVGFSNL